MRGKAHGGENTEVRLEAPSGRSGEMDLGWGTQELHVYLQRFISFLKKDFFNLFLERREGREEERERNISVREKHQSVASRMCPHQRLNPQPRHVP